MVIVAVFHDFQSWFSLVLKGGGQGGTDIPFPRPLALSLRFKKKKGTCVFLCISILVTIEHPLSTGFPGLAFGHVSSCNCVFGLYLEA